MVGYLTDIGNTRPLNEDYINYVEEDNFKLEFYTQPYIEGYDRDFNSKYSIPISLFFSKFIHKIFFILLIGFTKR